MGILDIFRTSRPNYLASGPEVSAVSSPWSEGQLASIVWSDVFGDITALPITRAEALSIPAVSRGRNLLVTAIAGLPLRALDANGPLADQPRWMSRTDGPVSPWHRMAGTVDDLIFFGASLWLVKRGADGLILEADRCQPERWKVTNGNILVDDQSVDSSEVIYIPGPHDGLLTLGSRTLRGARDTEAAWVGRAKNPIPMVELHQTDDTQLDPEDAKAFVQAWAKARRDPDGAIGYTPKEIELRVHGAISADMAIESRNAVRTDVGSFLGIPSGLMDASLANASLTYVTAEGTRSQFLDYTLPLWTDPIQHRLSMDDVVARGTRVRLDLSGLTGPTTLPTGAPAND